MKYLSINLPNTHEASLRETAKPRWTKPKESETGGGVSRGRGPGDSVSLRRRFSPSGSPDPVWLPSKPQPVAWWTRATRLQPTWRSESLPNTKSHCKAEQ